MHQPEYTTSESALKSRRFLPAVALLFCQSLFADSMPDFYEMAAIEDSAHGQQVISGNYHAAIAELDGARPKSNRHFAASTNLCVAYTITKQFDQAASACEAAIAAREHVKYPARWFNTEVTRTKARDKAIALLNRGVLKAVTGDTEGARQDFENANRLKTMVDARDNLLRLDAKSMQAAATK